MSKYSLISTGKFISQDDWIHPERCINSNELIYVTNNEIYVEEDNIKYFLKKGDILILEAGKLHHGYSKSPSGTSFFWAHFNGPVFLKTMHLPEINQLYTLFQLLIHYSYTAEFPKSAANYVLNTIFIEIETYSKEQKNSSEKLYKNVSEWIRINLDKKITVDAIAKYFGYNPEYFSRLFKKYYSPGIKKFIAEQKILYIKNLILENKYNLSEIAEKAGFTDYKIFLKFFKYHEGISPTTFKNLNINTHINKN